MKYVFLLVIFAAVVLWALYVNGKLKLPKWAVLPRRTNVPNLSTTASNPATNVAPHDTYIAPTPVTYAKPGVQGVIDSMTPEQVAARNAQVEAGKQGPSPYDTDDLATGGEVAKRTVNGQPVVLKFTLDSKLKQKLLVIGYQSPDFKGVCTMSLDPLDSLSPLPSGYSGVMASIADLNHLKDGRYTVTVNVQGTGGFDFTIQHL